MNSCGVRSVLVISSASRMRCFGFHTVPELSCSWDWWLGCCWTFWTQTTPRFRLPSEQLFLSQADNGYVILPHGHMRWMEQGVAPPLKHRTEPEDVLEEICRGGGQRCLTGICLLCGTRGKKEVNHLGVSLDSSNVLPCCVPQWSNGM